LQFMITGRHVTITDSIRAYAEEKTAKLPRYYDGITQVEVIVDSTHETKKVNVEIIARGEHGNLFVASEAGDDAYPCIDAAIHKLERQLHKKKTRERDDKHKGEGHDFAKPALL
jgi:putative sigma-54 modulation protein